MLGFPWCSILSTLQWGTASIVGGDASSVNYIYWSECGFHQERSWEGDAEPGGGPSGEHADSEQRMHRVRSYRSNWCNSDCSAGLLGHYNWRVCVAFFRARGNRLLWRQWKPTMRQNLVWTCMLPPPIIDLKYVEPVIIIRIIQECVCCITLH